MLLIHIYGQISPIKDAEIINEQITIREMLVIKMDKITLNEITTPTSAPPLGWWTIIREFGKELRIPFSPAQSNKLPMLDA